MGECMPDPLASHDRLGTLLRLRFRRSGASATGLGGLVTEHLVPAAPSARARRRPTSLPAMLCADRTAQQQQCTCHPAYLPGIHSLTHSGASPALRYSFPRRGFDRMTDRATDRGISCVRVPAPCTSMVCIGCTEVLLAQGTSCLGEEVTVPGTCATNALRCVNAVWRTSFEHLWEDTILRIDLSF